MLQLEWKKKKIVLGTYISLFIKIENWGQIFAYH